MTEQRPDPPPHQGAQQGERAPLPPGTVRIGQIAGIDVVVRTSWIFIALLIAFLIAPRVEEVAPGLGVLRYVAGLAFAVLLYLSILMHEASHAIAALRFGLKVRQISIHFLGGATELGEEAKTPKAEAVIAVVGPLTSLAVGGVALALLPVVPPGLLELAVQGLAVSNLTIGVLNLVPGLPLDGGRVLRAAVWRIGGDPLRATVVAAWGGRVVAVLVMGYPFLLARLVGGRVSLLDIAMAAIVAMFLWGGASASLQHARLRGRLPSLVARDLARRLVVVPEELPVAEAVRRAQDAEAGGIATHDLSERVVGLVDERALLAMPVDRRPWAAVSTLARFVDDGMRLPVGLVGEDLVRAMTEHPATEYLLMEPDGSVFGVLTTADVEAAFARSA